MSEHKQGATVEFVGGTGRNDADTVTRGIVNGPTFSHRGAFFVPVHVPEANHNVIVLSTNIVRVVA